MGTSTEETDWLGAPAAAAMLGIALRTLYRLVDQEGLPAYRMGRVIRLRRGEVTEWLQQQRVAPGDLGHLIGGSQDNPPADPEPDLDQDD